MDIEQTEVDSETTLRLRAVGQNITGKTVDMLVKEGFCSIEALTLVDGEDLSRTNIPGGQQKLVLKAIQPLQPSLASMVIGNATENNVAMGATCADRPPTKESNMSIISRTSISKE